MPLTPLQKAVLAVLARSRSEGSHFAGGIVLHADENSARYSRDFDIFHEAQSEVTRASEADVSALRAHGYAVAPSRGDWQNPSSFRQARLTHQGEELEIDWALDSAYRFFPVVEDLLLGWRLHLFDAATNKALALASRTVTRDYVDIVELDSVYPLEAIVWAACGKDAGYSPMLLLDMMRRFAKIEPSQLQTLAARKLDAVELKKKWLTMSERAETEINKLAESQPHLPIGVAFVDSKGEPGWPGRQPSLSVHPPSLLGCWPEVKTA